MREIKFRAWSPTYEEMFEVDVLAINEVSWDSGGTGVSLAYQPSIKVMQYTGLKDKNGKQIYEGDIVHLSSEDGMNYNALIIFEDGAFCAIDGTEDDYGVRRYGLMRYELQMEVIGNIYENPELLETR